jgi:Flp pilus assembly protein TadG
MRRGSARPLRLYLSSGSGASAVEFALIMPVLLMLIMGVFEYGRYLWTVNALQQTVTLTARCAGLLSTTTGGIPGCATSGTFDGAKTKAYAEQLAGAYGVALTDSNLTVSNSATCNSLAGFSQVSLNYTFTTFVPAVVKPMANGYTINASACFPNQS